MVVFFLGKLFSRISVSNFLNEHFFSTELFCTFSLKWYACKRSTEVNLHCLLQVGMIAFQGPYTRKEAIWGPESSKGETMTEFQSWSICTGGCCGNEPPTGRGRRAWARIGRLSHSVPSKDFLNLPTILWRLIYLTDVNFVCGLHAYRAAVFLKIIK